MELRGGGNASRRHGEKHQIAGNPVHEGDLKRSAVGGRDESEISGSSACHIIHRRLKAAVAIAEQKGNSVGVRVGHNQVELAISIQVRPREVSGTAGAA